MGVEGEGQQLPPKNTVGKAYLHWTGEKICYAKEIKKNTHAGVIWENKEEA